MERKSPQRSLKSNLNDLYLNSRGDLKNNSEILIEAGDIATNRGYSHQKRAEMIGKLFRENQDSFTDKERIYAQSLLNTSQNYLQNQAGKGRIKNYSIVKEVISGLKDNIQAGSDYAKFEANTKYLDAPENKVIPVQFTPLTVNTAIPPIPTAQPASSLEKKVVTADFTPNTTPANVRQVSFLGRAGKSLSRLIAVGSLVAVTAFYGLSGISCKPGPDPKDAIIQNLQAERQELGDKFTNTLANYNTTMEELKELKDKYNLATNNLATSETNLVETASKLTQVGKNYSSATNALNLTEEALAKKANSLAILETKKAEVERKFASTQIELLSTSNNLVNLRRDYSSATNQTAELQGDLAKEKVERRLALEDTRLTAEQLAKERKAHSETGNKLARTTGELQARTRDYSNTTNELAKVNSNYADAQVKNSTLSANLNSSARELGTVKSTLADRLRELKVTQTALVDTRYNLDETQVGFRLLSLEHGKTARNLTEATGKYNAMANLQGETAFKLSTTARQLANTSNSLVALTGDYKIATNDLFETGYKLFVANRELSKHDAVTEATKKAEEEKLVEARIVNKYLSAGQLPSFPWITAEVNGKNRRLENIQRVVFHGPSFIDNFGALANLGKASRAYSPTNDNSAFVQISEKAKLSSDEIDRLTRSVSADNLTALSRLMIDWNVEAGKIVYTNDGKTLLFSTDKNIKEALGGRK